jgi:hypothetical protein
MSSRNKFVYGVLAAGAVGVGLSAGCGSSNETPPQLEAGPGGGSSGGAAGASVFGSAGSSSAGTPGTPTAGSSGAMSAGSSGSAGESSSGTGGMPAGGAPAGGSPTGGGPDAGAPGAGQPNLDWGKPVQGTPPFAGVTVNGTVSVARGTVMGRLAPAFVGFSYEKSHLTDGFFSADDAPLVAMYKLLGPGVVRIGANDVDKTTWNPTSAPVAAGSISSTVGTADVDELAAFLDATGWRAIYGVNFKTSSAATSAAEAKYAASKLGANLAAFEIGNEPNFIGSWASVRPKWESFAAAIRTAVPNAPLAGPAAFSAASSPSTGYATSFAQDEASQVVLLTQHYYIAGAGSGSTIADMLSTKPAVVSESESLTAAVNANHIRDGFRWGEMNSYAHHGAPGVSNALASAFWGIDFMLSTAEHDGAGVNFHGGSTGMDGTVPFTYAPIQEVGDRVVAAAPLFYGMLLVSHAGTGNMLATSAKAGSLNFSAYTIETSGGGTNVVLVNKDGASGIHASVDIGVAATQAIAVYLLGSSLEATTGQTFAGGGVTAQGEWTTKPPYVVPIIGNVLNVLVPPASAVLVQAQ